MANRRWPRLLPGTPKDKGLSLRAVAEAEKTAEAGKKPAATGRKPAGAPPAIDEMPFDLADYVDPSLMR